MPVSMITSYYTKVSVKGNGSLQSNIEKTELLLLVGGGITLINLTNNKKIKKDNTF